MKNAQLQTKKHRFNIVDFVLIAAIIACIVGIAVRFNLSTTLKHEDDTAYLTVRINGLLKDKIDTLHEGDVFYYQTTDNLFGTLLSAESVEAKARFANLDGSISTTTYVDRIDVICRFEVKGKQTENGFMINGQSYIGVCSDILVRSSSLETQLYVLDVEPVE